MTQSPTPSHLIPKSSADLLTPFFFRGFLRLLYWSFFKPSAYRDYVAGILGDDADKTGWTNFRAALQRPQIIRLLLGSTFLVIVVSAVVDITLGLLSPESFSLLRVAGGVVFGVAFGVTMIVGFVRLPFYVVQLFVSLGLRGRDTTRTPLFFFSAMG
ncbi:MAG: hypothetical protein KA765_15330 [Thermoflexales bacterium]|nr:hypothetical protein [Thermoflexales bacterium]